LKVDLNNDLQVTGGTGFLGSHVIDKLLVDDKYIVRGIARSASKLQAIFPNAGSDLEVVEIPSLTSDFTDAFKGVSAVVHVASPGFLKGETSKEIFNVNILSQSGQSNGS
jgi:nucleoside-diphosphate-sugar epimerase